MRLLNTWGSRMGSSALDSTRRKSTQKMSENASKPITCTEAQGYVVPAKERAS